MAKKKQPPEEPKAEKISEPQGAGAETAAPLSAESQGVLRAAGIVGVMTIVSRLLGLWRFRLIAHIFGATGVADAFNFAFIFPNLTRRLFGEGALTSAFVPVFSRQIAGGDYAAASRTGSVLLWRLTWWLTLGCLALSAAAALAAQFLPRFMAVEDYYILELNLFAAMLPYCVLINVAAVLMGILNSLGHFAMPAFAPVLLNGLMILACYFALPWFGTLPAQQIWALAVAVLIGGLAQVLIQLPPAWLRGFRLQGTADTSDPGFQEVMAGFKPVMLLVAVFQINVMVDNIIAQTLIEGTGPVTYLNMGTSVYQLVWSIVALAIGTAALPALAKLWAQERKGEFQGTLLSCLRMVIFLCVPCTVGLALLSEDVVRFLYGTGKFLENQGEPVRRTAGVALFSTLGLVFFGVNAVLARALYAMKDMKSPTTTSAKAVALNFVLNLVLVLGTDLKESGIALASALSAAWQSWMLSREIRKRLPAPPKSEGSAAQFCGWMLAASLVGGVLGVIGYGFFNKREDWEGFWKFIAAMALSLIGFWLLARQYFITQLKHKPQQKRVEWRFGVADEHWPETLKFQFSLYTTALSSAIMGFIVWAVRDSVPADEFNFGLIAQRALAPVAVGVLAYWTAASGLLAREYDELKSVFRRRLKLK